MKSIKKRFLIEQKRNPNLSDFINFGRAVWGEHFPKGQLIIEFCKLVPKIEYDIADQETLIAHLQNLNVSAKKPLFYIAPENQLSY